jgi:TolB-like protein
MYCLSRKFFIRSLLISLITIVFLGTNQFTNAEEEGKEEIESQLKKALSYYRTLEFEKAISLAKSQFKTAQNRKDTVGIYEVLAVVTYAKGNKYHQRAKDYIRQIVELDPKNCELPHEYWPSELKETWYRFHSEPCEVGPDIQTVAVLGFENASVEDYEKLEPLRVGLAAFFITDLKKVTKLKIVEREKINYILKELDLWGTKKFDNKLAARIGKLAGAHAMVFGTFMKQDAKHMRVDARVVKTETGEVLDAASEEGRPKDIFKLEKNLVLKIAEILKIVVNKEEKEEIKLGGTESFDGATLYAEGLKYLDAFEYKKAYEYFKKAAEKDPDYAEAKEKMQILEPLL